MPDYTPLILRIAEEASSLEDLARLAAENGFIAQETVVSLHQRLDGLGSRIHGLAIYAGARIVCFALRADGVKPSSLRQLSRLLGVPVVAIEEAKAA